MSVLIKGMDMPASGVYVLSVDNTGTDKTVFTIAEHTRSGKVIPRHVGEAVTVTPHGRLIDVDEALKRLPENYDKHDLMYVIAAAPTIIDAEEEA